MRKLNVMLTPLARVMPSCKPGNDYLNGGDGNDTLIDDDLHECLSFESLSYLTGVAAVMVRDNGIHCPQCAVWFERSRRNAANDFEWRMKA